jgi:hypothetical protein
LHQFLPKSSKREEQEAHEESRAMVKQEIHELQQQEENQEISQTELSTKGNN